MPKEVEQFVCPVCGQHAPVERLTEEGPFEFRMFRKTLGGKHKLSEVEREMRKGEGFRRGSAHGMLAYDEIEVNDEVRDLMVARLRELSQEDLE